MFSLLSAVVGSRVEASDADSNWVESTGSEDTAAAAVEAANHAQLMPHSQTARMTMATMPPVSFLAVFTSAMALLPPAFGAYKLNEHGAAGASGHGRPQYGTGQVADLGEIIKVSGFLYPPFEIGDQILVLILIANACI